MLFKQIEGETAVIVSKGVFKQCDLYTRNGQLFAKVAGGFVRLYADGATSHSTHRLDTLAYDGELYRDRMGRLNIEGGDGCRKLVVTDEGRLQLGHKT